MCDVRTNYYRKKKRDYIETIYYLIIQDIAQKNKMYIIITCMFILRLTHYIVYSFIEVSIVENNVVLML